MIHQKIFVFSISLIISMCTWHMSFADEKTYPPYPDIWERVFACNIDDDGIIFTPINNGDVVIWQSLKADENGEALTDKKGHLIDSKQSLMFFAKKLVRNGKYDGMSFKQIDQTHSSGGSDFVSKDIVLRDGSRIRWIKGLVTDKYDQYRPHIDYKQILIDGVLQYQFEREWTIDYTSHTLYYNQPTVLERVDKDGKVLWQKVYLYFHPWWMTRYWKGEDTYVYNFQFFKLGTLALLDEDRMFLYFGGARKIFRLTKDGDAITKDNNLMVMNFSDYRNMLYELIKKLDAYEKARYAEQQSSSIDDNENSEYPIHILGDYDYFGERLAKKKGLDLKSSEVRNVLKQHKRLAKDIDSYYREMERKEKQLKEL